MAPGKRFALLIAGAATVAGLWWWLGHRGPSDTSWQGYAEADFVKIGPTQQGLLTAVAVARGDKVTAGAILFEQDDVADRASLAQAAAQLAQAEQALANLQAGGKPTEIEQAEANLADARATLARAGADLDRGEAQVPLGAMSPQTLDSYRATFRSAGARVKALEAALAQMRAPLGRTREIAAQQAAVDAARAAVALARWRLDQRHVVAPAGGRVADVMARPGETMAAGGPVVSLLPPENIFVRFFVPEAQLSRLHLGQAVGLTCDGCAPGLTASISFISPQAEYTPPVIYSEQSRAKLVYLIEARPPGEQAGGLNPGQPVLVSAKAR